MIWFLADTGRYKTEADAIEALAATAPWLSGVNWRIGDCGRLLCEAEISVRGRQYPVTLRYNEGFPYTPPSVLPRVQERWSTHQYGAGELCLEFGPDNWISSLTGADMLESAFRLLDGETPHDRALGLAPPVVPSRHALTLGQQLRGKLLRFFYSSTFQEEVVALTEPAALSLRYRFQESELIMWPAAVAYRDEHTWEDPLIPKAFSLGAPEWKGTLIPRPPGFTLENFRAPGELQQALLGTSPEGDGPHSFDVIVLVDSSHIEALFLSYQSEAIFSFSMVPPAPGERVYPDYATLSGKKIGLVGCGSVGSKVAAMLARAGVAKFVLVDDDIFQPENLVRNELDWRAVGEHKVDGLSRHLGLIQNGIEVDARRQSLGGQESGGTLHGTMKALSTCDLLIDATATPIAFNYVTALSMQNQKPLVWAEVFAGGIGGLVARTRPGLEPDPQLARARILQWCEEQNCPVPLASGQGYEDISTLVPHIADDADVSAIAAQTARMAIDTLIGRTPSYFPYSAYAIGLREGWIFSQPFDTTPIDLGSPTPNDALGRDEEKSRAGAAGIAALIEKFFRADAPDLA